MCAEAPEVLTGGLPVRQEFGERGSFCRTHICHDSFRFP